VVYDFNEKISHGGEKSGFHGDDLSTSSKNRHKERNAKG
jgi:hypothetical protein